MINLLTKAELFLRRLAAICVVLRQRAERTQYIRKYERLLGKEYAAEFYDKCIEFKSNSR